jgi:hypothetical protein
MWNISSTWVVHTSKLKSRIVMAKAGFYWERNILNSKFLVKLTEKLKKCYLGSILLQGNGIWRVQEIEKNSWKVLNCSAGGGKGSVRPTV